jgi:putative Mg2+ transporter-C (MgtC) family protein
MMSTSITMNFPQILEFFLPKIALSIVCGGILGLERELKNKPAGIKTNILICLAATLYTATSLLISTSFSDQGHFGDPGRVAAQIVSGIGLLGGGTIIQSRGTILGLTSAATIWVVAALGICIGIGHGDIAFICTLIVIAVMVGMSFFEDRILGRSLSFSCELVIEELTKSAKTTLDRALQENDLAIRDFQITPKGKFTAISIIYQGNRNDHKRFILELWNLPGIKEVKQT